MLLWATQRVTMLGEVEGTCVGYVVGVIVGTSIGSLVWVVEEAEVVDGVDDIVGDTHPIAVAILVGETGGNGVG